jgi:tetratricopeptide (TPR) repeat protein
MKKSFLRVAFVACLPCFAMGLAVVTTTPAVAAEKQKLPPVSKSVIKLIEAANKASEAKDWPTVLAKAKEAQAVPDLTDYDKYLVDRFMGVAYISLNDHANGKVYLASVVKNPATPVEDRKHLIGPAVILAAEANDYASVIELGNIAVRDNSTNPEIYARMTLAYYSLNDLPNTLTFAQRGVDAAKLEGKTPEYLLYQLMAFAYEKQKDKQNEAKALLIMARDYGKADDWKFLFDFSMELLPLNMKGQSEIAALDIYRLRMISQAGWVAQNYMEMSDFGQAVRSWGDARLALQTGLSKGVLTQAKVGQLLNEVTANAKKDEPSLATVEKLANTGKAVVGVGEAYYGYGRYADAARAAQKAIGLGGPTLGEATLLLAMCQVKQGDEATAVKTLTGVSGSVPIMKAADLWTAYLTRKTAQAQPAPAAAATH